MNQLDKVTYNFKLIRDHKNEIKTEKTDNNDEKFQGLFKETSVEDEDSSQWGSMSGIPTWAPGFLLRNLAAVEIDQMLGINLLTLTIPTIIPEKNNKKTYKKGILMEFVTGPTGKKAKIQKKNYEHLTEDLGVLYILDAIIGNIDRHNENYIYENKGNNKTAIKGIDNDLAFGHLINDIYYGEESNEYENQWYSPIEGKTEKNLYDEGMISENNYNDNDIIKIKALSKKTFHPTRTNATKLINGLTIKEVTTKRMITKKKAKQIEEGLTDELIIKVKNEMDYYLTKKEIEALINRIKSVKSFLAQYVQAN